MFIYVRTCSSVLCIVMYGAIKITILLKRGQTLSNKLKGWANTNPRDVGWGGGGSPILKTGKLIAKGRGQISSRGKSNP